MALACAVARSGQGSFQATGRSRNPIDVARQHGAGVVHAMWSRGDKERVTCFAAGKQQARRNGAMRGAKRLGLPAAFAQSDYPSRPIRLIVGFIPGSAADITARVLGQRMGQILGQQFVIEAKPGAGSSLAAEFVARAANDGYTLFIASSANITNAAINPKLPFDMTKDFTPIALINTAAVILVVPPSTGVKNVQELIALAKSKPGEILYASTGVGTAPHLSGELLSMRAGIKLVHVPCGDRSPRRAGDDDVFPRLRGDLPGRSGFAAGPGIGGIETSGHLAERADHGGSRHAGFRHLDLVRPHGAGRNAARYHRQAGARRARGGGLKRGGDELAAAGHRPAQRQSRRIRPPHRDGEQALGWGRPGRGPQEVSAMGRTED